MLIAAAVSAGPVRSALRHAEAAQPVRIASRPGGPIPDAPDSRAEIIAKIVGGELLVLAGPPLLLLWVGWDIWFALVGFFPALHGAAQGVPPTREPLAQSPRRDRSGTPSEGLGDDHPA